MTVSVYVYWDYACPFSYVGTHRLERIREDEELSVSWRPFEIHPGVPREGLPVKEAGYPPDRWAEIVRHLGRLADESGVELDPPSFLASSRDALQASVFALDLGEASFRSLHGAIFRAYFVDGRNIGRRETLLEVAGQAGVDADALARALEDGRYEDELRLARAEAQRYEITGTPTFLFHRHMVVGCAPESVLRDAASRARRDAEPATGGAGSDGGASPGSAGGPGQGAPAGRGAGAGDSPGDRA